MKDMRFSFSPKKHMENVFFMATELQNNVKLVIKT